MTTPAMITVILSLCMVHAHPISQQENNTELAPMSYISEEHFSGLSNVTKLDLSNRKVSYIHPNAFCGLHYLYVLDLSNNNLEYLDPQTFQCTPRLERLYLANNTFLGLGSHAKFLYSYTITYLDISNCNFDSFSDGMFKSMYGLKTIVATGNSICQQLEQQKNGIEDVQCNVRLQSSDFPVSSERTQSPSDRTVTIPGDKSITLSPESSLDQYPDGIEELKIHKIPSRTLQEEYFVKLNLKNLRKLDMSGLNITNIHPDAFCGLQSLRVLYLSDNDLQFVDAKTFQCTPSLQKLFLANNPRLGLGTHEIFMYSLSLKHIDISYCNFVYFSDEMFSEMKNLIFINAVGNPSCSQIMTRLKGIRHGPCDETLVDDRISIEAGVSTRQVGKGTNTSTTNEHQGSTMPSREAFGNKSTSTAASAESTGVIVRILIVLLVSNVCMFIILFLIGAGILVYFRKRRSKLSAPVGTPHAERTEVADLLGELSEHSYEDIQYTGNIYINK